MRNIPYHLIGLTILGLLWLSLSLLFGSYIVPYPHQVLGRLFIKLREPALYGSLLLTFARSLLGFSLAFLTGTVIGILSGSVKSLEKSLFLPLSLLQGSPPLLWVVPLVLILETDGGAPIAIVFFVLLPLVIINVQEGMKSISPKRWEMVRIYANSRKLILQELILPSLIPFIKSIFILGLVLALKSSIIGEWFGARNGIGKVINEYFYSYNMPSFYAVSLLFLALVGLTAFFSRKAVAQLFREKKLSTLPEVSAGIPENILNSSPSSLKLEEVSFCYNKKKIVDRVTMEAGPGDVIVLSGDSGCGKTTLARLCTGLLTPQAGRVSGADNPCIIFQEDTFLPHLDCFGNARLPGLWKKTADLDRITAHFLKLCGLESYGNYLPSELSGGMKKRLTFARALVLNPDFVILDEPFNNLHREGRQELWDLYFKLFVDRGIPTVIITHYPEELVERKVKHWELKNGKILIK